jgi:hypothetical protein
VRHSFKLILRERLAEVVVVATTRALLGFAEERGLILSVEDVWSTIIGRAAGANPSLDTRVLPPTRPP